MITEYAVLCEPSSPALQAAVERHIAKGWQPLGGVSMAVISADRLAFSQAIVRDNKLIQRSKKMQTRRRAE